MRQREMFPMIVDQKHIDDYLWYQKTLKQYQKHKKNSLRSHASFKNQYMTFLSWQDDPDYQHCQLELKKQIRDVKDSIISNENNYDIIESGIERCKKSLQQYNRYFSSLYEF
jgi:hypothetical protein